MTDRMTVIRHVRYAGWPTFLCPRHQMADDDTVISIDHRRPVRQTKDEQLAAARVKALESRRRTQKTKLETKLQQVKVALGDMDPAQSERTVQVILEREAELRNKHAKFVNILNDTLRSEAKRREEDSTRMKRHMDSMAHDIRSLREAVTKKRSTHESSMRDSLSTVSTKTSTLSTLSPLALGVPRK